MRGIVAIVAFLVMLGTGLACIGSPYGIDVSFSPGLNLQTLKNIHSIDTAIISEDAIVYRAQYDNRLAVRADQFGISMQVPLDDNQEPVFEFDAWPYAMREELEWLRMNGVISISDTAIDEVMALSHASAIIGVFDDGTGMAQTASAAYARAEGCGDPPILESAMPLWQLTEDNVMVYVVVIVVSFFAGIIIIFVRR